jgi:AtzE family amidohydrolase
MTDALSAEAGVVDVAAAVRSRRVSVAAVVDTALERVRIANPVLNAFVAVAAERARAHARSLDDAIARGEEIGPLAGVPFAVKAMIDVQSLTTTAGSRLHVDDAPASRDADVVSNLERAGAVCLGALNMDELGMGGTTENALFGPTRNPHDLACTPGGSSGGSAAAVAGRLVPLSVGGDGLGSIRLPASLCGVYGLRPTRGRVCARGTLGSANTLSALGPLARSADDLAAGFAAMAGGDLDPATLARSDRAGLRFAVAGGYFRDGLGADAAEAVAIAASALEVTDEVEYPEAQRARAAAILINAAESAPPQLANLRRRPGDFDPNTRDRFLAHALMPAAWYLHAMRFRAWHTRARACAIGAIRRDPASCDALHGAGDRYPRPDDRGRGAADRSGTRNVRATARTHRLPGVGGSDRATGQASDRRATARRTAPGGRFALRREASGNTRSSPCRRSSQRSGRQPLSAAPVNHALPRAYSASTSGPVNWGMSRLTV